MKRQQDDGTEAGNRSLAKETIVQERKADLPFQSPMPNVSDAGWVRVR
jgi:hypothetical protein